MKTYKSSSWDKEFTGTRTECIKDAILFIKSLGGHPVDARYSWRADDDSGFTLQIKSGQVSCVNKWNASRN